jgi:hypothetical protein
MVKSPQKNIKTLTLFKTRDQKSFRLSKSRGWVDLGNMSVNDLLLLKDYGLDETMDSKVYIQLRGDTGRPPIVNGTVTSIRAMKNERKTNEVHWTVYNAASYNHIRSFATRFLNESDALKFLTLFNSFATTAEVNDCLKAEVGKIEQDQEEVRSNEDHSKAHALDEEADNTTLDEDSIQFTQNWPDWHDMSMPFE